MSNSKKEIMEFVSVLLVVLAAYVFLGCLLPSLVGGSSEGAMSISEAATFAGMSVVIILCALPLIRFALFLFSVFMTLHMENSQSENHKEVRALGLEYPWERNPFQE